MNLQKIVVVATCIVLTACAGAQAQQSYKWTQFVQVEGQPEPVPVEWVSTPEGKFAHSIKIPNPVPKDSGYRPGMSSKEYFEHLCKTEAGEFIYKTVENVEGFYFMRPPKRPTDDDLMDRYKLEAPEIERTYQLMREIPQVRGTVFIAPPFNLFRFVEEPNLDRGLEPRFLRVFGYKTGISVMKVESVSSLNSRYGLTWRGITRANDRDYGIAGGEWIVTDLLTNEILAVMRNYGLTGHTRNVPNGIWWLNAISCPVFAMKYTLPTSEKIYAFTSGVLKPMSHSR